MAGRRSGAARARHVVEIAVQVNGKLRDRIEARAGRLARAARGARRASGRTCARTSTATRSRRWSSCPAGSSTSSCGERMPPPRAVDRGRRSGLRAEAGGAGGWPRRSGAAVAEAGAGLVCGGLGGVMEAACRGARSRGGLTVGLLPGHRPRGGERLGRRRAADRARRGAQRAGGARGRRGGGDRRRLGDAERDRARAEDRRAGGRRSGRGSRRAAASRRRASSPSTIRARRSPRRCGWPGAERPSLSCTDSRADRHDRVLNRGAGRRTVAPCPRSAPASSSPAASRSWR